MYLSINAVSLSIVGLSRGCVYALQMKPITVYF